MSKALEIFSESKLRRQLQRIVSSLYFLIAHYPVDWIFFFFFEKCKCDHRYCLVSEAIKLELHLFHRYGSQVARRCLYIYLHMLILVYTTCSKPVVNMFGAVAVTTVTTALVDVENCNR